MSERPTYPSILDLLDMVIYTIEIYKNYKNLFLITRKHRHATGLQTLYLLYWNQNNAGEKVLATCAAIYVENIDRK